jgi:PhzF family phenazine biosynthesis protein
VKLKLYQIDAFTDKLFGGNSAAVIPLKKWIPDTLMQQIALENNLSETVFFVPADGNSLPEGAGREGASDYDIRWFTPAVEINLCGHATLAAAHVKFNILKEKEKSIIFSCKSGLLVIQKKKDVIEMDFPSWKPEKLNDYPENLQKSLGVNEGVGVYKNRDLLVELNSEEEVKNASPDFTALENQ